MHEVEIEIVERLAHLGLLMAGDDDGLSSHGCADCLSDMADHRDATDLGEQLVLGTHAARLTGRQQQGSDPRRPLRRWFGTRLWPRGNFLQ